ncbi:MAG TPA: acyl-ACP thioesterase domain-containing protein [Candidatus Dormibacteraeota bacterium]|nr:acyl-ACP thioesterase domain-containing protein [Candidatus Dormibacteraeota bacterium]
MTPDAGAAGRATDADPLADDIRRTLTVPYRVRFDESTPAGTVRTSALLRYAQDCAWAHSERLGFGRDWYRSRGLFWLVRAVELRLAGTLPTGATAAVTTTVVGFRHVLARRRTTVAAPDGTPVASIDTDWAMVGDDGIPTRIPLEFPGVFGAPGERFATHRVPLPAVPDTAARSGLVVRPQALDPMAHANNAVYLDWLDEALAPMAPALLERIPRRYRLEYLLPARPGIPVEVATWLTAPQAAACLLTDADGELLRATVDA